MILFVTMSGLREIADGIQKYMSFDSGYTVIADYTSNRKYTVHPKTGRKVEIANLISSDLAEEISENFLRIKEQKYMEAA